jgi:hypothetical protein
MKHSHTLISLFSSIALLSACGGGGGGGAGNAEVPAPAPSPLDEVSPEASQSVAGMKKYIAALSTMLAEDREPVDIRGFTPPMADDSEPETVS